jgi:type I restriction enzyme S subunit
MKDWKEYKIENLDLEIIDGDRGVNYPKSDDFLSDGYCLFLNTGNVTTEGLDFQNISFISKEKDLLLRKGKLTQYDIILTTRGTIGNVGFFSSNAPFKNLRINSGMVILRCNESKLSAEFFYQMLKSPYAKSQFDLYASGTAQPQLPIKDLKQIKFLLPPLPTQQKIARILSAYDDLIETNQRRVALLEATARELYREWFVRLRFPHHAQTPTENGLPKGWRNVALREVVMINMGQSPSSEFYNTDRAGLPFHQGVGTYGDRYPLHTTFCSVAGRLAERNDILFSVRAPVGRLNIADCKLIIGRGLSAIRHIKNLQNYLFYMLDYEFSVEDIIGNGSIFNSVSKDEILNFRINYSYEQAIAFDNFVKPLDIQIETLTRQNALLRQTRDALLPRLLGGGLAVKA